MIENWFVSGGMAEWFKAAVLKTVERKLRGFESYSLRQRLVLYFEKVNSWKPLESVQFRRRPGRARS